MLSFVVYNNTALVSLFQVTRSNAHQTETKFVLSPLIDAEIDGVKTREIYTGFKRRYEVKEISDFIANSVDACYNL